MVDDPLMGRLASYTVAIFCKLLPCAVVASVSVMLAIKLNKLQVHSELNVMFIIKLKFVITTTKW